MSKCSKSRTVVLKQKIQIILIIQHYYAKPKKVLRYSLTIINLTLNKIIHEVTPDMR